MKNTSLHQKTALLTVLFLSFFYIGCSKGSSEGTDSPTPTDPVKPDIELVNGNDIYGYVLDEANRPVAGVAVTDGFTVVKTDSKGIYQFKKSEKAKFVYYSTPAAYEINVESASRRVAQFYKALATGGSQQVDFTLTKRSSISKNYVLLGIGDPQVGSDADIERFTAETIEDIKAEIEKLSLPVYGLSLGDVVADKPGLLNTMKSRLGSMKMTVFTTIGNHDKTTSGSGPKNSEVFTNVYGPTSYSFDIGQVHYVCLDNVEFSNTTSYRLGISADQISWMQKDLELVGKDKMLIVYYHMPIRGSNFSTRTQFFELIKDFKEVHLFSGHTHYAENYIHTVDSKQIYEHVHAATCGAWWKSTLNGDGTPNGYMIFNVEGTTIKDWLYKPTKLSRDFQLRLHWGDMSFGGQYGYFNFGQAGHTLVANVWNADKDWKVEVYMNGQKLGDMEHKTTGPLNQDAWSMGYHIGVLNRNPSNYSTTTKHLYTYKVDNPNSTLKVVATDRFGRTYEQTEIVSDLSSAASY